MSRQGLNADLGQHLPTDLPVQPTWVSAHLWAHRPTGRRSHAGPATTHPNVEGPPERVVPGTVVGSPRGLRPGPQALPGPARWHAHCRARSD